MYMNGYIYRQVYIYIRIMKNKHEFISTVLNILRFIIEFNNVLKEERERMEKIDANNKICYVIFFLNINWYMIFSICSLKLTFKKIKKEILIIFERNYFIWKK